ncbi:hypothetical protein GCM10009422_09860 [Brevundimonas kwangchunensis]|uniref:Lipoprotein n=1 Tax=Brevundimonas kwangchunensis TaxID=322163 RepID=A0ABN1GQR2_9CAUL
MTVSRPVLPLIAIAAAGAVLAGCATGPSTGGYGGGSEFNADAFAWSARPGQGVIQGRVAYVRDGQTFNCIGNAGLIPDTAYTRARMQRLYGSTDRADVPAAVVRARSAGEQGADYRSYERAEACTDNAFRFSGLPDGSWFIITPVRADGDPVVLMRHVITRGGRQVSVTLG